MVGDAVHVMRTATGGIVDRPAEPKPGTDAAAASLGKRGGAARAKQLTPERRAEIARKAATRRRGEG